MSDIVCRTVNIYAQATGTTALRTCCAETKDMEDSEIRSLKLFVFWSANCDDLSCYRPILEELQLHKNLDSATVSVNMTAENTETAERRLEALMENVRLAEMPCPLEVSGRVYTLYPWAQL